MKLFLTLAILLTVASVALSTDGLTCKNDKESAGKALANSQEGTLRLVFKCEQAGEDIKLKISMLTKDEKGEEVVKYCENFVMKKKPGKHIFKSYEVHPDNKEKCKTLDEM